MLPIDNWPKMVDKKEIRVNFEWQDPILDNNSTNLIVLPFKIEFETWVEYCIYDLDSIDIVNTDESMEVIDDSGEGILEVRHNSSAIIPGQVICKETSLNQVAKSLLSSSSIIFEESGISALPKV